MKTAITIASRRDAYGVSDVVKSTYTVGELIDRLREFDEDTPVCLSNDGGYTYGIINGWSFEEKEFEEE